MFQWSAIVSRPDRNCTPLFHITQYGDNIIGRELNRSKLPGCCSGSRTQNLLNSCKRWQRPLRPIKHSHHLWLQSFSIHEVAGKVNFFSTSGTLLTKWLVLIHKSHVDPSRSAHCLPILHHWDSSRCQHFQLAWWIPPLLRFLYFILCYCPKRTPLHQHFIMAPKAFAKLGCILKQDPVMINDRYGQFSCRILPEALNAVIFVSNIVNYLHAEARHRCQNFLVIK